MQSKRGRGSSQVRVRSRHYSERFRWRELWEKTNNAATSARDVEAVGRDCRLVQPHLVDGGGKGAVGLRPALRIRRAILRRPRTAARRRPRLFTAEARYLESPGLATQNSRFSSVSVRLSGLILPVLSFFCWTCRYSSPRRRRRTTWMPAVGRMETVPDLDAWHSKFTAVRLIAGFVCLAPPL